MTDNKKRWFYLAIATILLIFCGLIYGWSLFKIPFSQVYPDWTLSQISVTFTISMISFALGGFISGQLIAKTGPRVIILSAACLLLAGFLGVSRMNATDPDASLAILYLCYGVLGGGGVGLCHNAVVTSTTKWFPDKPGLALGTMLMGFGIGALLLGSAATTLVGAVGVFQTFSILGIAIFVILIIGAIFFRIPKPLEQGEPGAVQEKGTTPLQMLKRKSFWLFFTWVFICSTAGLIIINSAASIALMFGAPAIVGMVVSICNGSGRVFIGGIFDRFGRKDTMLINMCFQTAECLFLIIGAMTSSIVLIILGLLCAGICYGGHTPILSTFINQKYGKKHYAINLSICNFAVIPAALLGPIISSWLIESSNGNYHSTFYFIGILTMVDFAIWGLLNKNCAKANAMQDYEEDLEEAAA